MALGLLLVSCGNAGIEPEPETARPYAFPTASPYNVPNYAVTPTPDGTGEAIHPSVVDMVAETGSTLRGYRYWMAMTPYPAGTVGEDVEDPCILASNGGYDWKVPAGMVNPIDHPDDADFNSDTEMIWDPEGKRLVVYWRRGVGTLHAATSTNGVTWTKHMNRFTGPTLETLSPAICRVAANQWVMFLNVYNYGTETGYLRKYTSASPLGPWALAGSGSVGRPAGLSADTWHFGVEWDGARFMAACQSRDGMIFPATSVNGTTWTIGPVFLTNLADWQNGLYRPSMVLDGPTVHVWYSTVASAGCRTAYTRIPVSAWPT